MGSTSPADEAGKGVSVVLRARVRRRGCVGHAAADLGHTWEQGEAQDRARTRATPQGKALYWRWLGVDLSLPLM